jgi:heme/copper-type cytochrome/quinol oxidase subunit 2
MIKRFLSFLLVITAFFANAQGAAAPQMADAFRENGKIYVVITVIGLIFLAIVIFLIYIERKLRNLENKVQDFKADN